MKRVSNAQVAHSWVHGQTAQSCNMNTDGVRLYSYRTLIGFNTGKGLVFITNDGWTLTTKKQLCSVSRAAMHLDIVYSDYFEYGCRFNGFDENQAFKTACEALNDSIEGYSKANLSKHLALKIEHAIESADQLRTIAIKYGYAVPSFTTISQEFISAAKRYAADFENTRTLRAEQALIKRRHNDEKAFTRWRNGEPVPCPVSYRLDDQGGHYVTIRGDKVLTSGGADCPIEHARRGTAFWKSRFHCDSNLKTYCEPWQRNGHTVPLGIFQLDSIDAQGTAHAGCHKFYAEELNRLAQQLL